MNRVRHSAARDPIRAGLNVASLVALGTPIEPGMRLRSTVAVPVPSPLLWVAMRARMELLLRVLELDGAQDANPAATRPQVLSSADIGNPRSLRELRHALTVALADAGTAQWWLAYAVLSGALPIPDAVVAMRRRAQLSGPWAALQPPRRMAAMVSRGRTVEVAVGQVVVDVHHTAHTDLATGIQRVARETTRRWVADHGAQIVLAGWDEDYRALRRLSDAEQATALHAAAPAHEVPEQPALVPWQSTYLIPELAVEPPRTSRMQAMAAYGTNACGVIGFDCVPITSGETVALGMGAAFARNLAAVRHMDRVCTISVAAAREYRGWRRMLVGIGLPGPDIAAILLPSNTPRATDAAISAFRTRYLLGRLPMVLVVGSHEPRKNHLAVLAASEQLWHEGIQFSLLFIGGNSWGSERFTARLAELQGAGQPVRSQSGVSDDDLWAAYQLAHVLVFPSLNEGFGLPVAEALAGGTPAITSEFGSMAEAAHGGGALLVDPRDDDSIANAMRRVLVEPGLVEQLRTECAGRPRRSWDDYARQTWDYLVHAALPPDPSETEHPAGLPAADTHRVVPHRSERR